ncbi:hypothetical protein Fleli_2415 [Bernardetia litoralis DSM 6794]|uniref:Uncharacterized protein n=1 Tax=Bernardetia litoralis (strain ATCC 23117 / DSM 6794 / NBRC 15988 / NCIMB 1366 / Fx l1 / Sio-4) TaxID=880071 RepID=I4ALE7_BERLS|nr:hypothetical protein Fleli_2415 [Bernardetia litoralis DSM 6794]
MQAEYYFDFLPKHKTFFYKNFATHKEIMYYWIE